jgi:hypothetical protein
MNVKKKLLTTAAIGLLLCSAGTAKSQALQGRWTVNQITVAKSVNGEAQPAVTYENAAAVQSRFECPQIWEFGAESVALHNAKGTTTAKYSVQGNRLLINQITHTQSYEYVLAGGTLTLTVTHKYVNNPPSGQLQRIVEQWTIQLTIDN